MKNKKLHVFISHYQAPVFSPNRPSYKQQGKTGNVFSPISHVFTPEQHYALTQVKFPYSTQLSTRLLKKRSLTVTPCVLSRCKRKQNPKQATHVKKKGSHEDRM